MSKSRPPIGFVALGPRWEKLSRATFTPNLASGRIADFGGGGSQGRVDYKYHRFCLGGFLNARAFSWVVSLDLGAAIFTFLDPAARSGPVVGPCGTNAPETPPPPPVKKCQICFGRFGHHDRLLRGSKTVSLAGLPLCATRACPQRPEEAPATSPKRRRLRQCHQHSLPALGAWMWQVRH
jgi:hypothetical protein